MGLRWMYDVVLMEIVCALGHCIGIGHFFWKAGK